MFTPIDYNNWERREIYELFKKRHFVVNVNLDISTFLSVINRDMLKFYPCACFCIAHAANQNKNFRMAVYKGNLGSFNVVHPHYTLMRENSDLFTQTISLFDYDLSKFYAGFLQDKHEAENSSKLNYHKNPCPNTIHISILPDICFNALSIYGELNNSPSEVVPYIPFVVMGKYFKSDNKTYLPIMVDFSHCVNDGKHADIFIKQLETSFNSIADYIK